MKDNNGEQINMLYPSTYNHQFHTPFNRRLQAPAGIIVDLHSDKDLSAQIPIIQNRLNKLVNDFTNYMKLKGYIFKVNRRSLHLTLYGNNANGNAPIGGAYYRYDGPSNQFEGYSDLRFDLIAPPIGTNSYHDQYRHETAHVLHAYLVEGFSNYQPITEGFAEFVQYYLDNNDPCIKTHLLKNASHFNTERIFATHRTTQDDMYGWGYWFNLYMSLKGEPKEHLEMLSPQKQNLILRHNNNTWWWENPVITKKENYIKKHHQRFVKFLQEMQDFCSKPKRDPFTLLTTVSPPPTQCLFLYQEVKCIFEKNLPLKNQVARWSKSAIHLSFKDNARNSFTLTENGFSCENSRPSGQSIAQVRKNFIASLIEMTIFSDNCYDAPIGQLDAYCADFSRKCYTQIENEFISLQTKTNFPVLLKQAQNTGFSNDQVNYWENKFKQFTNATEWSNREKLRIKKWDTQQCQTYRSKLEKNFKWVKISSTTSMATPTIIPSSSNNSVVTLNTVIEDNFSSSSSKIPLQWGEVGISGLHGLGVGFVAPITNSMSQCVCTLINKYLPESLGKNYISEVSTVALRFGINATMAAALPIALGTTLPIVAGIIATSLAAQGIAYGAKGVVENNRCLKPLTTVITPALPLIGNMVDIFTNENSIAQNSLNTTAQLLGGTIGGMCGNVVIEGIEKISNFFKKPNKISSIDIESTVPLSTSARSSDKETIGSPYDPKRFSTTKGYISMETNRVRKQ